MTAARAALGYAAGCLTAAIGVAIQFGAGIGLMVAGVITAVSFLLLDVGDA